LVDLFLFPWVSYAHGCVAGPLASLSIHRWEQGFEEKKVSFVIHWRKRKTGRVSQHINWKTKVLPFCSLGYRWKFKSVVSACLGMSSLSTQCPQL
jgi:hypothetical protein